jgi:predicted RNA binding protein YcfA (HicA-like mRNA interferase family)
MIRPVKTQTFRKFLTHIGLVFIRIQGDHEIWDRPDVPLLRPVTFITNEKEVPPMHIKTNLKTIGMSLKEFYKIIQMLK